MFYKYIRHIRKSIRSKNILSTTKGILFPSNDHQICSSSLKVNAVLGKKLLHVWIHLVHQFYLLFATDKATHSSNPNRESCIFKTYTRVQNIQRKLSSSNRYRIRHRIILFGTSNIYLGFRNKIHSLPIIGRTVWQSNLKYFTIPITCAGELSINSLFSSNNTIHY